MGGMNTGHTGWAPSADFSNGYFDESFACQRVMVILRGLPPGPTVELCETAWRAGIDLVEVPLQDEEASASLEAAGRAAEDNGRRIGVGTVTRLGQVEDARRAGAAFTVAPGLDEEVARASLEAGMPHLPGAATATEVQGAMGLGLRWVKLFPAAQLTPGWVKALKAPFPSACFVATGGVDVSNAGEFLEAGARAVAVGSALADPGQVPLLTALNRSQTAGGGFT